MIKKIILQRDEPTELVVFGKMYLPWIKDAPDIYTIEPLRCIPKGIYALVGHNTEKFSNVWRLAKVPGFTGILIHAGNFASDALLRGIIHSSDSKGCILPGFDVDESVPMVSKSRAAIAYLRAQLGIHPHGQPLNIDIEIKD